MRKKRILWCGESSFLSTGYAVYGNEVLKRLYNTGKYEIMELGSYGPPHDPRESQIPWEYMHVLPENDEQRKVYDSSPIHQFGEWKFESACLKFKPDVVIDIRDWWMLEFQERSPFRKYFNWAIMPTVDAEPQDEQWLSTYMNADGVFTYSDWGMNLLKKQTGGSIKSVCSAPPGADLKVLKPAQDKRAHRKSMNIDEDCFIVGTVMRNQRRKLYPDLVQAFKLFLDSASPELAKKTYLYLHTSWPDYGWDIPKLITEAGIGSKCIFTYTCTKCNSYYPSFFSDAIRTCKVCGRHSASMPNSHAGISREGLANVINLFDVYVQYANSEGFGMPQVEAAACGVPVMSVDYSAMHDVVRKLKGYPIEVQRLWREPETHCWRAMPSNKDFVDKLIKFFSLPEVVRARKGYEARLAVEEHYTYEKTAKKWEDYIDSVEVKDGIWESPAQIHKPVFQVPSNLTTEEFVKWGIVNVAGRPELLNGYTAMRMIRDLNCGACLASVGMGGMYYNDASTLSSKERFIEFNRDMALNQLYNLGQIKNYWEMKRTGQ